MRQLTTHDQLTLQVAAAKAFTALRRATPEDGEALAAAAYVAASVSPSFDELAGYAAAHGLPVPDRDLYDLTMRQLAELAALVTLTPETQH